MIRYLVWDVDGTLLDTYPSISRAMLSTLESFGCHTDLAEIDTLCKISFAHCAERLAEDHVLDISDLNRRFMARLAEIPAAQQGPFPGVMALCRFVEAQGGANYILTHRDRESLSKLLVGNGIAGWFADAVAGDDGHPRKPDPTGLNALLDRNNVRREEILVIGDRELDVQAAHAAGVRACFYGTNPSTTETAFAVTDYGELLQAIQRENGVHCAP